MRIQDTENPFAGQTIYAGIDVHKKSWKTTIMGQMYEHKTFSQNPDPEILARYLKKHFPGARYEAVYESGFSGFVTCRHLRELGIECQVIHAADVPTSQKERKQKSDKADSRKLARTLRNREFTYIDIPDKLLEADRTLVRQRFTMSKEVARTKNRVKSLLLQYNIQIPDRFTVGMTRNWSKNYTNWLKEIPIEETSLRLAMDNYLQVGELLRAQLLRSNRQLRALSQEQRYKRNYELLLTIPGIGLMTAMTFLVQLGDVSRFKTLDQLCSYVGLVPSMYGSGEKMITGKMIKRGRKELKIMLIESSWQAVGRDPAMMLKFNHLVQRMQKNKAIIRIARKMLSRIRYVLQNEQPYEIGILN